MIDIWSNELNDLSGSLDFHSARHKILASNITNSETPGFKPFDLVMSGVDANFEMHATHPDHAGSGESSGSFEVVGNHESMRHDGNGVELEKAMSQVTANRLRYNAAIELTRRRLATLKYAATNGVAG